MRSFWKKAKNPKKVDSLTILIKKTICHYHGLW